MPHSYTVAFKKKIIRLHMEARRTLASITAEYGVSKSTLSMWCKEFNEECRTKASLDHTRSFNSLWTNS